MGIYLPGKKILKLRQSPGLKAPGYQQPWVVFHLEFLVSASAELNQHEPFYILLELHYNKWLICICLHYRWVQLHCVWGNRYIKHLSAEFFWYYIDGLVQVFPVQTQLALRRWPNVNPYVGPTSAHQRWANVDLSFGPTVARQRWPNDVPTSAQRWHTNVGPTVAQRYANGCMPTLCQHWPNGGCVPGFLWGEPIGHRWIPLTKGQERWRWCLP